MEGQQLSIIEPNDNNKIFNAKTKRWIQNTSTNRNRLQSLNDMWNQTTSTNQNDSLTKKSSNKTMKKSPKSKGIKSKSKSKTISKSKSKSNELGDAESQSSYHSANEEPIYMPIKDYGDYRLENFSGDNVFNTLYGPNESTDESIYESIEEQDDEYLYESGVTTDACNTYNKIPMIDLNLISKSNTNVVYVTPVTALIMDKKYLSTVPGVIKYGEIDLPVVEFISSGSFGTVYRYSQETQLPTGWVEGKSKSSGKVYYYNASKGINQWEKPYRTDVKYYAVAVKTYNDVNDPEINLIKDINKTDNTNLCNTVNARIISLYNTHTLKTSDAAVMDLMDGTLYDLVKKKLSIHVVLDIIYILAYNLECLNKLGKVYTDLKSANVLYKCFKNNKLKVSLGDLGGICNRGGSESSTYPPPEFTFPQGKKNCQESTMVWGLGIILLELLGINTVNTFAWNNTEEGKFKNREEFIKGINIEISNVLKKITDPIVKKLLSEIFLKKNRITLQGILDYLLT